MGAEPPCRIMPAIIATHTTMTTAMTRIHPHPDPHEWFHRSGTEKIATQEVEIKQEGSTLHVTTVTRGLSIEEGGYHWSGELRLWDNEILMGWYASNDGSIRSKGTMYFVVHPHGLTMAGRWVGLGYDDQIMTGFASMAHSREESEGAMTQLIHSGGEVTRAID
jgi:hypothetical protein